MECLNSILSLSSQKKNVLIPKFELYTSVARLKNKLGYYNTLKANKMIPNW